MAEPNNTTTTTAATTTTLVDSVLLREQEDSFSTVLNNTRSVSSSAATNTTTTRYEDDGISTRSGISMATNNSTVGGSVHLENRTSSFVFGNDRDDASFNEVGASNSFTIIDNNNNNNSNNNNSNNDNDGNSHHPINASYDDDDDDDGGNTLPVGVDHDEEDDDDDDDETLIGMEDIHSNDDRANLTNERGVFATRDLFGFDYTDSEDDDPSRPPSGTRHSTFLGRWYNHNHHHNHNHNNHNNNTNNNVPSTGSLQSFNEIQERRRHGAVVRELERTQRSNFSHFVLLCLVPTSLLLIVVISVLGDQSKCLQFPSQDIACVNEPRTFVNAFTTRCLCDAVSVEE